MEIASGRLGLRLDPRTGSVTRIVDRSSGVTHLDATGDALRFARLFRVIAPVPRWSSRQADSWISPPPRIDEASGGLDLHWSGLSTPEGPLPVRAIVEIRRIDEEPELTLRLTLHNDTDRELSDVLFPWLGGLAVRDGGPTSFTLGGVRQLDVTTWPRNLGLTFQRWPQRDLYTYPIDLYSPWADISGPAGGLGLISRQREARNLGVAIENLAGYAPGLVPSIAAAHFPAIGPGATWSSPEIAISLHDGDWRETADRYTRWIGGWLPAPRTPPWTRRSIGFQNVMFRSFEGKPVRPFEEIPAIARQGLEFGVDHLCVWDYDLLGEYSKVDDVPSHGFSAGDRAALAQGIAGARSLGVHVSALENYRLAKPHSKLWRESAEAEACRRYDGTPYVEEYCTSGTHGRVVVGHVGPYVHPIDPRGPRQRERILSLVDDSIALGFDSLFHDQPFENWPSYTSLGPPHGPDGVHAGTVALLDEVRELIRAHDPDGIMVGEYADVFATPSVDLWMSWYTDPDDLERAMYSLPMTLQSVVVDADPARATHGFMLGAQLCLTTHGCEGTLADEPAFATHVASLARLRARIADRFGSWSFRGDRGIEQSGDGPGRASVFESASGRFLVCGSPGGVSDLEIRFDADRLGWSQHDGIMVARPDGTTSLIAPSPDRDQVSLRLQRDEVAVVWPGQA